MRGKRTEVGNKYSKSWCSVFLESEGQRRGLNNSNADLKSSISKQFNCIECKGFDKIGEKPRKLLGNFGEYGTF